VSKILALPPRLNAPEILMNERRTGCTIKCQGSATSAIRAPMTKLLKFMTYLPERCGVLSISDSDFAAD
jgi:hypothetical protein